MANRDDLVLITRFSAEESQRGQRVYVTGPHFGFDIYSSTFHREQASRFPRFEAERLLAEGKWRNLTPQIEELA